MCFFSFSSIEVEHFFDSEMFAEPCFIEKKLTFVRKKFCSINISSDVMSFSFSTLLKLFLIPFEAIEQMGVFQTNIEDLLGTNLDFFFQTRAFNCYKSALSVPNVWKALLNFFGDLEIHPENARCVCDAFSALWDFRNFFLDPRRADYLWRVRYFLHLRILFWLNAMWKDTWAL